MLTSKWTKIRITSGKISQIFRTNGDFIFFCERLAFNLSSAFDNILLQRSFVRVAIATLNSFSISSKVASLVFGKVLGVLSRLPANPNKHTDFGVCLGHLTSALGSETSEPGGHRRYVCHFF